MTKHKGYDTPDTLAHVYAFARTVEEAERIAADANSQGATRNGKFIAGTFKVTHIEGREPAVTGTLAAQFRQANRCQNCGCTRKEHGVSKPYKCPTRLQDDYWTPWTPEAYAAAEETGKAAEEIELVPDFDNLFRTFSQDAKWRGEALAADLVACTTPAQVLRCVQGFLAPATIALNSATTVVAIEAIREILSDTLVSINSAATAAECAQEDDRGE